jgi:hypothetical protein
VDDVARSSARDRADLFNEAAARRGLAPAIVEKDFWVCWTLKRLCSLPGDNPSLVFKGGTSLSKIYQAIKRFSEDIDLSFDRRDLGYVGDRDPQSAPSRKKKEKLIEDLVGAVTRHIQEVLMPRLAEVIKAELPNIEGGWQLAKDDADPQTLIFRYPASFRAAKYRDLMYVNPVVRLELGARGDPWPAERRTIIPYAAEEFPAVFNAPSCDVVVLGAERTFWEKATLLHSEYHRPAGPVKERLSRHCYDLALLADTEAGQRALKDIEMLEKVTRHKEAFFYSSWSHYETAKPGTLRLVPPEARLAGFAGDYAKMAPMIFDTAPRFEILIERLRELERQINGSG